MDAVKSRQGNNQRSNSSRKRFEKDHFESNKSKRARIRDELLFGDIDDINDEIEELLDIADESDLTPTLPGSPKQPIVNKTTIQQTISQLKRPTAAKESKSSYISTSGTTPDIRVSYRRVLKHIPAVPHIPVTVATGERRYLRIQPDVEIESQIHIPRQSFSKDKGLLGTDFSKLRSEAETLMIKFKQLVGRLSKGDTMPDSINQRAEVILLESNAEVTEVEVPSKTKVDNKLWVEKYKPGGYMDLLSEEMVNHSLLHWMKLWDKCVFGTDYLLKHKELRDKYSILEAKDNAKVKRIDIHDDTYDELGRPKQKIVLLHGPAGLGKTTAAHIIARHAGYKVVELNASDDRSVEVFRKVLDSTTQSRSEMFQNGRPNCLVVDEIDGAPGPTVEVLVQLVSGKAKEAGKNKTKKFLRRPIICICNDIYAPSLRNLRTVALILQFHPVLVSALVERIDEISLKENMRLDHTILQTLAERSDCDIRSCISTLQFVKQKSGKITHGELIKFGTKDAYKGLFAVWDDVFFLPKTKRYYETVDPTRADARFNNVLRVAQNFGDYEKLHGGIFENYLRCKFKDSYFETILNCLEWNIWFGNIEAKMNRLQNFSIMGLLPMFFVANHFLIAGRNRFHLQIPTYTNPSKFLTNFTAHLNLIQPSIGRYINIYDAILDVFPFMMYIIQPATIRPIPCQLWSPKERDILKNIVHIMTGYNLNYLQQRTADGSYIFQLDPNIEELVKYDCEESSNRKPFPYTIKQIIGREIEVEKMRNAEGDVVPVIESPKPKQSVSSNTKLKSKTSQPENTEISKDEKIPNWKQALQFKRTKEVVVMPVAAKDFFGRALAAKVISPEQAKRLARKERASEIWYSYREGFSNAVKKKLKLKDFL